MVVNAIEEEPWTLYFDSSSRSNDGGACIGLINPEGRATTIFFKQNFPCTNNVVEYEAFIMGLSMVKEMGMEKIKVIGDSNLMLSQLHGGFAVNEPTLATYRATAERLVIRPRVAQHYCDKKKDVPQSKQWLKRSRWKKTIGGNLGKKS